MPSRPGRARGAHRCKRAGRVRQSPAWRSGATETACRPADRECAPESPGSRGAMHVWANSSDAAFVGGVRDQRDEIAGECDLESPAKLLPSAFPQDHQLVLLLLETLAVADFIRGNHVQILALDFGAR